MDWPTTPSEAICLLLKKQYLSAQKKTYGRNTKKTFHKKDSVTLSLISLNPKHFFYSFQTDGKLSLRVYIYKLKNHTQSQAPCKQCSVRIRQAYYCTCSSYSSRKKCSIRFAKQLETWFSYVRKQNIHNLFFRLVFKFYKNVCNRKPH